MTVRKSGRGFGIETHGVVRFRPADNPTPLVVGVTLTSISTRGTLSAEVAMRRFLVFLVVAVGWVGGAEAQFVAPGGTIPAVAHVEGVGGVFWRSDVSVLNLSPTETSVVMLLLPDITEEGPSFDPQVSDPITIPGGGQLTVQNVMTTIFNLRNSRGGLSIFSTDGSPLVIASRTYVNLDTGGTYGLNVTGVLVADQAWIANVEEDGFYRTNVGIFLPADPQIGSSVVFTVTVKDDDGIEVGARSVIFEQAGLRQENLRWFGADFLLGGSVEITCSDPDVSWFAYATVIDQVTADSVYRPAIGYQASLP